MHTSLEMRNEGLMVIYDMMEESHRTGVSLSQLIDSKREDAHMGAAPSQALAWLSKRHTMYCLRREMSFRNVHHFSMVSDPSTHSKLEVMIGVFDSCETGVGANGDIQRIPPNIPIHESEQILPDQLQLWLRTKKQERIAAFREMQAISHCIYQLTAGEKSLQDFVPPDGISLTAVHQSQVRVVLEKAHHDEAIIVNTIDNSRKLVWPEALAQTQCNVLTIGLDQGSVGAAGVAFAVFWMGATVLPKWDKFHRAVRDIKLSISHAANGVFLKTQLYSSYLWNVNSKPFGHGAFSTQKKHFLNIVLIKHNPNSAVFLKYGERIAACAKPPMPWGTQEDREAVFENIPELAHSFVKALTMCKLGRWFSWNDCAHEQLQEYWVAKMLYESAFEDAPDPDADAVSFDEIQKVGKTKSAAAELAAMRKLGGGLRLAYRLMTSSLFQHATILYVVTNACWDWYTQQVKEVKSPRDAIEHALAMTQGNWMRELHLQRTISETFEHPTNLDFIGIPMGVSILAGKVFSLSVNVLANRCWSFAVRHHGAPDIYAGLFSASRDKRSWAKARMEEHWKRLLVLEQRRFSSSTAMQLWSDLLATRNNAVRMMYCAFERDKFKEDSSQGCKLLRALLETLPDNKIVEDGHGSVQLRGAFCDFCNFRTHSVVANRASGRYWQPNVK